MVMAKKPPFALVYAHEVKHYLQVVETKYYSLIESEIRTQLLHEPDVETRNRKPLKRRFHSGPTGSFVWGRTIASGFFIKSTWSRANCACWQLGPKSGTVSVLEERSLENENRICCGYQSEIERLLESE